MTSIVAIARRLFPFDYSITGPGADEAVSAIRTELNFAVREYASGCELNGWKIPPACVVEKAEIHRNGVLIHDATRLPMGVAAQSDSFVGTMPLQGLSDHLFTAGASPDAIPYHWQRLYRPDEPLWGFCVSQRFKESLTEGEYEVKLITRKFPSSMKVLTYELEGQSKDTVIINAHNCHPYQANDDISGVAVGIEMMRHLARRPRRLTYLLLVAPELFGPMFWLDEMPNDRLGNLKIALLLKSIGNPKPLRFQQSFTGNSAADLAAHNVFRQRYGDYECSEFRALYGNDETVFEAPPFSIPSVSLTRWPFPEYHTNADVPDRLSEHHLQDTLSVALEICDALEMDIHFKNSTRGLVSLSRHGLYKPVPVVGSKGVDYGSLDGRWNRLMNSLPRELDGKSSLLNIAERYGLPIREVHEYVCRWESAGLAHQVPAPAVA